MKVILKKKIKIPPPIPKELSQEFKWIDIHDGTPPEKEKKGDEGKFIYIAYCPNKHHSYVASLEYVRHQVLKSLPYKNIAHKSEAEMLDIYHESGTSCIITHWGRLKLPTI